MYVCKYEMVTSSSRWKAFSIEVMTTLFNTAMGQQLIGSQLVRGLMSRRNIHEQLMNVIENPCILESTMSVYKYRNAEEAHCISAPIKHRHNHAGTDDCMNRRQENFKLRSVTVDSSTPSPLLIQTNCAKEKLKNIAHLAFRPSQDSAVIASFWVRLGSRLGDFQSRCV